MNTFLGADEFTFVCCFVIVAAVLLGGSYLARRAYLGFGVKPRPSDHLTTPYEVAALYWGRRDGLRTALMISIATQIQEHRLVHRDKSDTLETVDPVSEEASPFDLALYEACTHGANREAVYRAVAPKWHALVDTLEADGLLATPAKARTANALTKVPIALLYLILLVRLVFPIAHFSVAFWQILDPLVLFGLVWVATNFLDSTATPTGESLLARLVDQDAQIGNALKDKQHYDKLTKTQKALFAAKYPLQAQKIFTGSRALEFLDAERWQPVFLNDPL